MKTRIIHQVWNPLIFTGITFVMWLVGIELSFGLIKTGILLWTNIAISILFAADIWVRYEELKQNPEKLSAYLKGPFWLDLIAMLPVGLLTNASLAGALRLAKLPRLINLMRDWRLTHYKQLDRLRLLHAIYWMLLVIHGIACGWYFMRKDIAHTDFLHPEEWAGYLDSVYWAVATLGTVGYGDITPETLPQKVYAIFTMLVGIGFFGFLIGNVAGILSKKDPAREKYISNLDRLSRITRFHHMPEILSSRIYDYYTYQWEKGQGVYDSSFIEELPKGLKKEVSRYLRREVIEKVPLFKENGDEFLDLISTRLNSAILTPSEVIFRKGDKADRMYFIVYGKVRVYLQDGEEHVAELQDGQFFGEIALFLDSSRTATVRAVTFCDVYYLTKADFDLVLEKFPNIGAQIRKELLERVRQNAGKMESVE